MAFARTQAYGQGDWNNIEKTIKANWKALGRDIKAFSGGVAARALKDYGYKAIKDIDNYSSYDTDTGNLDDSLMFGIFTKGIFQEYLTPLDEARQKRTIQGSLSDLTGKTPEAYKVRSNASVVTRYGNTIQAFKGQILRGRDESLKALKEYQKTNATSGGYYRPFEMVIVAEMYYRYFLENKNNYNWISGFVEYESNYATQIRNYQSEWNKNWRAAISKSKNFKKV